MKWTKEYIQVSRNSEAIKVQLHEENNDDIFIPHKRGKHKAPNSSGQEIQGKNLRKLKRNQEVHKGSIRRFADIEEMLDTEEVIDFEMSDDDQVPSKKRKTAVNSTTTRMWERRQLHQQHQ